jgi:hypothetical protein
MKFAGLFVLVLTLTAAPAFAKETCDQMKTRIDSQIQGHGVKTYTLDIIDSAEKPAGKVVASCESGKKKVVYKKG